MKITLTEKAVKEIKHIIADQGMPETVYVRAAVKGGGCSGFQSLFTLDETYNDKTDILVEQDGLKIVVDKRSALYLEGTTIDFLDEMNKRGFKFDVPGATGKCGCGSSFSM